jgi:hypothetical protein
MVPSRRIGLLGFQRYIGIDYSGAETPTASLKGLRVYSTEGDALPASKGRPLLSAIGARYTVPACSLSSFG